MQPQQSYHLRFMLNHNPRSVVNVHRDDAQQAQIRPPAPQHQRAH